MEYLVKKAFTNQILSHFKMIYTIDMIIFFLLFCYLKFTKNDQLKARLII